MSKQEFDSNDLEALRQMKAAPSISSPDGRRLRSADGVIRDVQMNTRVRREIKELAHEIARIRRLTIAEVIELAIERLHREQGAQSETGSPA